MKATVFRIHILFTVVAVAMLPDQDPCELMDNVHRSLFPARLQETRPSQSAQQASTTLTALEAAMAAACQGCNATEVQKRINTLITSMLALDDAGMSTVEGANARTVSEVTHHMLNCPVCQSLVRLGTTAGEIVLEVCPHACMHALEPATLRHPHAAATSAPGQTDTALSRGSTARATPPCMPLAGLSQALRSKTVQRADAAVLHSWASCSGHSSSCTAGTLARARNTTCAAASRVLG